VPSKQEIVIGKERIFKFDRVFAGNSSQQEVYDDCIKDLVLGCFEGYNAAVLAYGQTGSTAYISQAGKHTQWEPTPQQCSAARKA
jgi:kinesin family member 27